MVSVNSESIAGTYSPHFWNSELVMVIGALIVICILVFTISRRWRKHQDPKVQEYLKKNDISASDIENRKTIEKFLDVYDSFEDEDEVEIFRAKNIGSVASVSDERYAI